MKKILVFQSNVDACLLTSKILTAHPGYATREFSLSHLDQLLDARSYLEPGKQQLLITGSRNGSNGDIAELTMEFRRINPELVCMSYSTGELPGPFDHVIEKSGANMSALRIAVDGFLNGSIRRNDILETAWLNSPTCPSCGHKGITNGGHHKCMNCGGSY